MLPNQLNWAISVMEEFNDVCTKNKVEVPNYMSNRTLQESNQ